MDAILLLVGLVVLTLTGSLFGVDSRDGSDWNWTLSRYGSSHNR